MARKTTHAFAGVVPRGRQLPSERFERVSRTPVLTKSRDDYLELRYRAIAQDPKYAHFVHIPDRIIRCLDHFQLIFDPIEVRPRLASYYLFIGVVDEAIDSGRLEIGEQILAHLRTPVPFFADPATVSNVGVATEVLRRHISDEVYSSSLARLQELYQAVVRERQAEAMPAYIEERKAVGSLTAELSYLIIQPFLAGEQKEFCRFMQHVGTVGCLVDSVIDLAPDTRRGLLSFKPSLVDFPRLIGSTLHAGLGVTMKHPALFRLFLEAVTDNLKDRFRSDGQSLPRLLNRVGKENAASVV